MAGYIGFKIQNVAFPLATSSSPGLMSAFDKNFFTSIDTVSEISDLIKTNAATVTNTADTLVLRDVNGDFSATNATLEAVKTNTIIVENTTNLVLTTTTQAILDSNSISVARSFKYTIQAITATEYQVSEVLVIHDGTTSYMNEFGTIFTGSTELISLATDINTGNVRLLVTPTNANTTIKFSKVQFN